MPLRKTRLVTNNFYHIYNRSLGKIPIFKSAYDYNRALELVNYYRFENITIPFSKLVRLAKDDKQKILKDLQNNNTSLISILSYCFMPNHFHFLIKQEKDNGIVNFFRLFQNSYAKYFNIKYGRFGPLFQNRFKSVIVEDEYQLIHLSRYIHLNPYTGNIITKKEDIFNYPWSSCKYFLNKNRYFCEPGIIFQGYTSNQDYKNFLLDRADYQKQLSNIKHILNE